MGTYLRVFFEARYNTQNEVSFIRNQSILNVIILDKYCEIISYLPEKLILQAIQLL